MLQNCNKYSNKVTPWVCELPNRIGRDYSSYSRTENKSNMETRRATVSI